MEFFRALAAAYLIATLSATALAELKNWRVSSVGVLLQGGHSFESCCASHHCGGSRWTELGRGLVVCLFADARGYAGTSAPASPGSATIAAGGAACAWR
jgi:hypothetical protein